MSLIINKPKYVSEGYCI